MKSKPAGKIFQGASMAIDAGRANSEGPTRSKTDLATTKVRTTKDETFRQELDALYRENFRRMYRAAKCVTGHRNDAEEATQNVFERLIEGQPSSDFRKNPKAYLCKADQRNTQHRSIEPPQKMGGPGCQ